MELSIIIVSYNTKTLTLGAINSIYKNLKSVSFEVILIDNGSSDGSVEALRLLTKKHKNLKLIENDRNTGFAFANNQGIRISKGNYILLLNSDTVVTPGAIEKLVVFAESTPNVGVVAPRLLNKDGSIQHSVMRFPTIKNAILTYFLGKKGLFEKYAPSKSGVVESVVGAAFLITPRAKKLVGLLDEKYFFYFEDIDYCRRVYGSGLSVYYLADAEIYHYHGASGKKIANQENQWRRLIPSSKLYHGLLGHYTLFVIMFLGQKWQKLLKKN